MSAQSDTLPLIEVDDNADTKLAQQISQISGVGAGQHRRRAEAGHAHPARSREAGGRGLSLEDVRAQLAIATVNSPKGSIDGATRSFTIYANDQLTKAEPWNDVIVAYRNGAPMRVRDIGQAVAGPEDAKKAGWANGQARRVPDRLQAARRQRHRDRRPDQGAAAAAAGRDPARHQGDDPERPHADDPRLGGGRPVHAAPHDRRSSCS